MKINGKRFSPVLFIALSALTVLDTSGCVSSGAYQAVKKEAEDAQRELKWARERVAAIEKAHTDRKTPLDELIVKLGGVTDRLDGISKSFGDLRSEVTRLRIARELERGGTASGISFAVDSEPPLPQLKEEAQPKPGAPAVEPKQRIKDLLQNLHNLLEKGEPKAQ